MSADRVNIADRLTETAARLGDRIALCVPRNGSPVDYDRYSFATIEREANRYAAGLAELGIGAGTRTLLAVKPGFDLIVLTFALFKTGAAPVLIDPGMGKRNLLDCVARSKPEAMVGIPKAFVARLLYPTTFATVKRTVTVGRRWLWGGATARELARRPDATFAPLATKAADLAAILFTTGSTGPPKGVLYTHAMFDAQLRLIRDHYGVSDDDVDYPAFPLFALFSIALGMRVVIPVMDFTRPASVDPQKVVDAVIGEKVTFTFGSPAIWKKVSCYCADRKIVLPTLRRVLMAGAPVAAEIHRRLLGGILPDGAVTHTPFGATESLPVADITGAQVLAETADATAKGKGVCVGLPLPGFTFRIAPVADGPFVSWADAIEQPTGAIGEIMVTGPTVAPGYFDDEANTRLHNVTDPDGRLWRRMGDVGYLDDRGRLWFCGRKGHRVVMGDRTLYTIPVEAIFNAHPLAARTALVGVGEKGAQTPVLVVEPEEGVALDKTTVA
ncbi:MAG: AMP-binding protein, partial [Nitrospinae bacterium]|nr:AMP-binding protein [Nitrospinota bacterium]